MNKITIQNTNLTNNSFVLIIDGDKSNQIKFISNSVKVHGLVLQI